MIRVMIMAGGTGGHVYPALSIADELRERNVDVVWLGTKRGLESRLVPKAGLRLEYLDVSAWMGTSWRRRIFLPFVLLRALWQALNIVSRWRPSVVLGMGGFAAGPGGLAAWLMRRPLLIHEANARAGRTNRLLAPLAKKVLTGFSKVEKFSVSTIWTGNPVRSDIALVPPMHERELDDGQPVRVLVLGGSQGAEVLNQLIPEALSKCASVRQLRVVHQSGPGKDAGLIARYNALSVEAVVSPFIDDMANAYAQADLVISRAGAMTVSELCIVGRPAILIPYPYAADDHQYANAASLVKAGAAIVIRQRELDPLRLASEIDRLSGNRDLLWQMAIAAHSLAKADATDQVVAHCLGVAYA